MLSIRMPDFNFKFRHHTLESIFRKEAKMYSVKFFVFMLIQNSLRYYDFSQFLFQVRFQSQLLDLVEIF